MGLAAYSNAYGCGMIVITLAEACEFRGEEHVITGGFGAVVKVLPSPRLLS